MKKRLGPVALTLLLSGIALDSQARLPTFIAIVREDGGLVPIAIFDGREWWNRWPWSEEDGPASKVPVPESLDAIPADWLPPAIRLPREWTLHLLDGGRRKIQIDRPFRPPGWTLVETIVLRSTYASRAIRQGLSDGSDDVGVAIAGPGRIGMFSTPSASESQRILAQLRQKLAEVEQKAIQDWETARAQSAGEHSAPATLTRTHWGEPTDPFSLVKATRPFRGRTYYFLDGGTLYFVGGDARYPEGCKLNVSVSGVVVAQPDRGVVSEKVSAHGYAEYCGDRPGWMTLLATLEVNGGVLWIVRTSVEDGFDYALFDPDANDPVPLKDEWRLRSNR